MFKVIAEAAAAPCNPPPLQPSTSRTRKGDPPAIGLAKPGLRSSSEPYRPWCDDYRLLLADAPVISPAAMCLSASPSCWRTAAL
jgi:hypothetical protein